MTLDSWEAAERGGRYKRGLRWPGRRRRHGRRREATAMVGEGGYGARTEEWGEGDGPGAHSGLGGLVGELVDALKTAGRRR